MYYFLAFLSGIILSCMLTVNGRLTDLFGIFQAAVIIHIVGSVFAILLYSLQKNRHRLWNHTPLWIYSGGAVGVLTTVFSNLVFGKISITAIIALMLFGQTFTSLVIDTTGLFKMEKHPLRLYTITGFIVSCSGIFLMLRDSILTERSAVCTAFLSGITAVVSRTINARLSEKTGALEASLINHLTGLPVTVIVAFIMTHSISCQPVSKAVIPGYCFLGGIFGVLLVLLYNITVPRISSFYLTVLSFMGQFLTGFILNKIAGITCSAYSLWGSILIFTGIILNLTVEYTAESLQKGI